MARPLHITHTSGPDFHVSGGRLTIDLDALAANYRRLAERSRPARIAAVVKADAYGLGIEQVVPALLAAGCDSFFVALPHEGARVRAVAPDVEVHVLSGPLSVEGAHFLREHRLTPVLNSPSDLAIWEAEGWDGSQALPCALYVDTGMNRLGLTPQEAHRFAQENALTRSVNVTLVLSHLACADDPAHPMNARQLESFHAVTALFPGIDSSLCNSGGIMMGGAYLHDLTRAGIALYGGAASHLGALAPVAHAEALVLQVRHVRAGDCVGYGAAAAMTRDTVLAIAATGYADGYHRAASGGGVPLRDARRRGGCGYIAGRRAPIVGRISMDITAFDVTDLGEGAVAKGDWIELFGPNLPLDEAAEAAGTIGYELLTGLGRRFHRVYVGGEG